MSDPTFTAVDVPVKLSVASYYYRFYLARALIHAGLGNRYLKTLGPWKAMLANGLTTGAERQEPTRSDSHAYSAHPNYGLLSTVAGIVPASPEFKSVRIEPRLGPLKHVEVTPPTPQGAIALVADLNQPESNATASLPAGMSATLSGTEKTVLFRRARGSCRFRLPSIEGHSLTFDTRLRDVHCHTLATDERKSA